MEATKPIVVREGVAHAKGNKTDPVYQDFAVREWSDGFVEYYLTDFSKWVTLPEEWRPLIQWDAPLVR